MLVLFTQTTSAQWVQTKLPPIDTRDSALKGVNALCINGNDILKGRDIIAGTENGAYLCTNNGTSWTPLGFSSEVFSIAVSGIQIYAGTEYGGVYLYNNNTANWTPVDSGLFA